MLLNRSHVPWFWFTLLATLASVGLYILVFHPGVLPVNVPLPSAITQPKRIHQSVGNSWLGLTYGSIAYAIFIFAVLLNRKKKFPLRKLGNAQGWLRAHIWLTILTLPLVFMHAAFRFGGAMTSTLMWLYLLVMASGFYGLALQQFMPRILRARLPMETIFEEIPFLTQQLLAQALKIRDQLRPSKVQAEAAAAGGHGGGTAVLEGGPGFDSSKNSLLIALERDVLPYLASSNTKRFRFNNPNFAAEFFRVLRVNCAPAEHDNVDQLAVWCEQRRQMDMQVRYHHILHSWLLVHIPSSFLLIILTGWHAVVLLFLY